MATGRIEPRRISEGEDSRNGASDGESSERTENGRSRDFETSVRSGSESPSDTKTSGTFGVERRERASGGKNASSENVPGITDPRRARFIRRGGNATE